MLSALLVLSAVGAVLFFLALFLGATNIRFHTRPREEQVRIACVGDSTTYGTLMPHVFYNCYPARLGRMLGQGYHTANFGFNGKTVRDDVKNSYRHTSQYPLSLDYLPHTVILLLGANDTKPANWRGPDIFREHYLTLVRSYLELPTHPRLLLCTPCAAFHVGGKTRGSYRYGINEEGLDAVRSVIREVAGELALPLVDLGELTADHPEWYLFDGIHLNRWGAKAVADRLFSLLT